MISQPNASSHHGIVLAQRDGHRPQVKVAVRRRFGDRGPRPSKPQLSAIWYVLAAYFGSILLKSIHGAKGLGGFTSDERLALGVAVMIGFLGLVTLTSSILTTIRERA